MGNRAGYPVRLGVAVEISCGELAVDKKNLGHAEFVVSSQYERDPSLIYRLYTCGGSW